MGKVSIVMDSKIRIPGGTLPEEVIETLRERLVFKNPLWEKNRRENRPNHGVERFLRCIWTDRDTKDLVLPKGYLAPLIRLLHKHRVDFEINDKTLDLSAQGLFVESLFRGRAELSRPFHWEAMDKVLDSRFGILIGPPGSGRKMLACRAVAERKTPALVICSTKRALYVWREAAMRYLGLEEAEIGLLGDGHKDMGRAFTVAITVTLGKVFDQIKEQTGFVIVDQCDTANLKVYFKVGMMPAAYILGIGRSPRRRGGLTGIMNAYLGPRLYQIYPEDVFDEQTRPAIRVRGTGFDYANPEDFEGMLKALCEDDQRNHMIAQDVLEACADEKTKAVVLSNRLEHLEQLHKAIEQAYGRAEIISSHTSKTHKDKALGRFERGALQVLLLSSRSISSFDSHRVNALFVASPIRFEEHLTQAVGLLFHGNNGQGRRPMIYDYRDKPRVLQASLKRRLKIYRTMGAK